MKLPKNFFAKNYRKKLQNRLKLLADEIENYFWFLPIRQNFRANSVHRWKFWGETLSVKELSQSEANEMAEFAVKIEKGSKAIDGRVVLDNLSMKVSKSST